MGSELKIVLTFVCVLVVEVGHVYLVGHIGDKLWNILFV